MAKDKPWQTDLAKRGFESVTVKRQLDDGRMEIDANKLHPLELGDGETVYAPIPVSLSVGVDQKGHVQSVDGGTPDAAAVAAALHHVKTLRDTGQLAPPPASTRKGKTAKAMPAGTTHQLERDQEGRLVLRRKRFSIS